MNPFNSSGRATDGSRVGGQGRQIPGTVRVSEAKPELAILEVLPGRELQPEVEEPASEPQRRRLCQRQIGTRRAKTGARKFVSKTGFREEGQERQKRQRFGRRRRFNQRRLLFAVDVRGQLEGVRQQPGCVGPLPHDAQSGQAR